ncbi:MAG: hypothetical protein KDJ87_10520 [Rhizobiaceae bacterium]|nr:hypothetical protein [Rhizobiaceae bacterium]
MISVVTVSANTAAFAAEPLKPSARVSGMSPSEKTVHALAAEARKSGDYERQAMLNVVQPPALALFFLTAERQPDSTLQQAYREYLDDQAEERRRHNSED